MSRRTCWWLVLLLLAGCGGGTEDPPAPPSVAFAERPARTKLAADPRAAMVTADMTLDWAEHRFADLFDARIAQRFPSVDYEGQTYNARAYSGAWGTRYLGITPDRRVFGLGDFTQGRLQQFDTIDHWAPQILLEWCSVRPADCTGGAIGYGAGTPVAPANAWLDDTQSSDDGAALAVSLADGSRVDLPAQPAPFAMALERQAGNDADMLAALAQFPGLRATGSVRGLYAIGSDDVSNVKPKISIPAQDAAGLNPDTLVALRVGTAIVDGEFEFDHVSLLPVTRNAQGGLTVVDALFRDGLLPDIDDSQVSARKRTTSARMSAAALKSQVRRATPRPDMRLPAATAGQKWVGGALYMLTTFQDDLNWKTEPQLVRMLPDPMLRDKGWRRPATATELAALARQPICNLVLLVHGHNETEKVGNVQTDEELPWGFGYKKRVWDLLYQTALSTDLQDQALYPHACTAFYEFIYPSYRAIYSPVSAKGGGIQETLGEAMGRLVREETARNPQLAAMLTSGMPLNTLIVGHSQGGLVARAGLRFMPTEFKSQVKQLVTWGTPHHGAALVSMRYALQQGHDLVIDGYRLPLQSLAQWYGASLQIDTPGARDLRLEERHQGLMDLRGLMPSLDQAAAAALATPIYSRNLDEFNTNIGTREIEPGPAYTFLTGTSLRSATIEPEDASFAWTLLNRGRQVARFTSGSTPVEQGATLNRLVMKSGHRASDGAAPLFSQQGAKLYGPEAIDMGDVDHEEFYGSEPPQRSAASLAKGRMTAERSLHEGRLDEAVSACPSIQGLSLNAEPGGVSVTGRAYFPSLAATPARTGAQIQRVEARAGSVHGTVIAGLAFQHDASGQFSATAGASTVPVGPVAVVVVLKDGSELQGLVEQAAPSDFDTVRVFEMPWTVTENREGLMRAEMSRQFSSAYFSGLLECSLAVSWTLPRSHTEPLQMRIERLLKRDGVVYPYDGFSAKILSYSGRDFPVGDGRYARRTVDMRDPPTSVSRTAGGANVRDLNLLPATFGTSSVYVGFRPTLYIEVDGLCGGSDTTQIRFDYKP